MLVSLDFWHVSHGAIPQLPLLIGKQYIHTHKHIPSRPLNSIYCTDQCNLEIKKKKEKKSKDNVGETLTTKQKM